MRKLPSSGLHLSILTSVRIHFPCQLFPNSSQSLLLTVKNSVHWHRYKKSKTPLNKLATFISQCSKGHLHLICHRLQFCRTFSLSFSGSNCCFLKGDVKSLLAHLLPNDPWLLFKETLIMHRKGTPSHDQDVLSWDQAWWLNQDSLPVCIKDEGLDSRAFSEDAIW
jgi:hypothetical protein